MAAIRYFCRSAAFPCLHSVAAASPKIRRSALIQRTESGSVWAAIPENRAMIDKPNRSRSTEPLAGNRRLEAMTLRCEQSARRQIETAFERERQIRPHLSLGRFLAECVANGLPGNLPSTGSTGADADAIAALVDEILAIRLSSIEDAVPAIADVLGDLSLKVEGMQAALECLQWDGTRTLTLIEQVAAIGKAGDPS